MFFDFSDYRRDFPENFQYLKIEDLDANPYHQCALWFQEILNLKMVDGNAMTLATANKNGSVSSRVVLLKYLDQRGFTFFSNYHSRKGKDLAENPQASLTFYWPSLNRQLRVSGSVHKIPLEESKAYFHSRPKRSQLLAIASHQGEEISSIDEVTNQIKKLELTFKDKEIPIPDYWGGYRLVPLEFEFWQGGGNRINLRFLYIQKNGDWLIKQLSP